MRMGYTGTHHGSRARGVGNYTVMELYNEYMCKQITENTTQNKQTASIAHSVRSMRQMRAKDDIICCKRCTIHVGSTAG